MVPEDYREFFTAVAGVSGALVGLLFVAISVAPERVLGAKASVGEQTRAGSALSAFLSPLTLSLLALLPGRRLGVVAIVLGALGLLYAAASGRRLLSAQHHARDGVRGLLGFAGFMILNAAEVVYGVLLAMRPADVDAVDSLAVITVASLLLGMDRAWLMVGARGRGVVTQVVDLVRGERTAEEPERDASD